MRIPRGLSGADLARALSLLGYEVTRQTGSHMRLTTQQRGEHHVTVPKHAELRLGTLSALLGDVATHAGIDRAALIELLFGSRG